MNAASNPTPGAAAPARPRIAWLDIARGIAILCIVVQHYLPSQLDGVWAVHALHYTLCGFHVPVFFVISGLTFSPEKSTLCATLRRKAKALLAPWMVFVVLGAVCRLLAGTVTVAELPVQFVYGALAPNAAWFIPILFFTQMLLALLVKLAQRVWPQRAAARSAFLSVCLLAAWLLGYAAAQGGWLLPFGLQKTLYSLVFLGLGYFARPLLHRSAAPRLPRPVLAALGAVLFAACGALVLPYSERYVMAILQYPNYWLFLLTGLLGTLAVFLFSMAVQPCKPLAFYGRHSLFICFTHEFFIGLFNNSGPFWRPLFAAERTYMVFMVVAGGVWFCTFLLLYFPLCSALEKLRQRVTQRGAARNAAGSPGAPPADSGASNQN